MRKSKFHKQIEKEFQRVIEAHAGKDTKPEDISDVVDSLCEAFSKALEANTAVYEPASSSPMAARTGIGFESTCEKCKRTVGSWRKNDITIYDGKLLTPGSKIIIL